LYDAEDVYEYETLDEEILEEDQTEIKHESMDCGSAEGNDAVSFLTGILKKAPSAPKKIVQKAKRKVTDMMEDSGSRKHVCNVCQKKFQKRSNLIDHLRLHANVKVFSCDYCEKSFVQAGNFKVIFLSIQRNELLVKNYLF
jgi:ribosomal protein L37AE/L43A